MNKIKIFSQEKCPTYEQAKEYMKTLSQDKLDYEFLDVSTAAGLGEAALFGLLGSGGIITPSVLVMNPDGSVKVDWLGTLPNIETLKTKLNG